MDPIYSVRQKLTKLTESLAEAQYFVLNHDILITQNEQITNVYILLKLLLKKY